MQIRHETVALDAGCARHTHTAHRAHNGRARRTVLQDQVGLRRVASRRHLRNVNPQGAVDFACFAPHITSAIGDASGRTPCRHHRRKPDRALVWLPSDPLILFDIRIWRTKVAKRSPGCRTRPATTVTAELHSIVLPPVIRGASRLSPASSLHPCRGASPTDTWWDIPASR